MRASNKTVGRIAAMAATFVVACAAVVIPADTAHAATSYDRQLSSVQPLFAINAPDHAGAQQFTTPADTQITSVSAYLFSQSPVGTFDAQIRTDVADPATTIADSPLDIADLGGSGEGWVNFPIDLTVSAGQTYYLVVQATGTSGKVDWNGVVKTPIADALPSWNYDLPYWGGWKAYTYNQGALDKHLAFGINLAVADNCGATNSCYKAVPGVLSHVAGLLGNGTTTSGISPVQALGAAYVSDSNVLKLPDGDWRYLPDGATVPVTVPAGDPGASAQIAESRAWLATGTVPGRTAAEREMSARALLSMRLLTLPNGANAAGWYGAWKYSWPRDSSFVAVAFAATGHSTEAYSILKYNAETQSAPSAPEQTRPDGTWNARTLLDGSGPPDARHWQLDANGWVPWSIWEWYKTAPGAHRNQLLRALYPAVQKAADYTVSSLDSRGLPPAEPDYAELPTTTPNIGTAAPLLSGLHASAELARVTGHPKDAQAWDNGARRLADGIATSFAPLDYPRTLDGIHGLDSAVTFMAPPYNNPPAGLSAAIDRTYQTLLLPNGGISPYQTHNKSTAYLAETGFFALAWSGMGQQAKADQVVDYLLAHRNTLGELPEQINMEDYPTTVAPLGWTDAVVLLTLTQLDGHQVPVPPAPCALPPQSNGQCRTP